MTADLHFLHIGKTGGSALKHALRQAQTGDRRLRLHPHPVTLRDVPAGEPVVFFLRDPITRFVSGFYSRQRQGRPRYHSPWNAEEQRAFERFSTAEALGRALSAPDPEPRAAARDAMRSIGHVRDSFWTWLGNPEELRRREGDILFIGQQEHLADDVAVLGALLGLRLTLPDDPVAAHRNPADLDRTLSAVALANLRRWYAADAAALLLCRDLARRRGFGGSLAAAAGQGGDPVPT